LILLSFVVFWQLKPVGILPTFETRYLTPAKTKWEKMARSEERRERSGEK
jgi:hypothetical protein